MKYLIFGIFVVGVTIAALAYRQSTEKQNSYDTIPATTSLMAETFSLTSPAFEQNGRIPSKYTCDGDRKINPPLEFSGVPEGTKSLALIMDDPDVPKSLRPDGTFDHWIVFDIPADARGIPEGGPVPGISGMNGAGANAYTGPCPPPQYEPSEHRYIFRLYALSAPLALASGASKNEVLNALVRVKLAQAELIGRYSRK